MAPFQKWNCSWTLIGTVASLLVLVSLVHMFFYPLVPSSLDYFGAPQARNSCYPVNESIQGGDLAGNVQLGLDLDTRFPSDSHGAVIYRGAPWKAEIGRWFSGCDSITATVGVVEVRCGIV